MAMHTPTPLRTRIGLWFLLWVVIETTVFGFVVAQIGVGAALIIGIATSMIGASLLKRIGTSALTRLRQEASGPGGPGVLTGTLALDDTLAAIGALLLVLPGFATDLIGIVLAMALPRRWFAGWIKRLTAGSKGRNPQHGPASIDLDPGEWRLVDEKRPSPVREG